MLQFILMNVLMVGIGTILFLVVRSLPRIGEEAAGEPQSVLERLIASGIPEKFDAFLNRNFGKLLRKLNVYSLRSHNYLTDQLKKMQSGGNGAGSPKVDFKEMNGAATSEGDEVK